MFSNLEMPSLRTLNTTRNRVLLLLLAAAVCLSVAGLSTANGIQFQWQAAPYDDLECGSYLRCAEWCVLLDNGWEPLYKCCIDPNAVNTSDQAACQGLRQIQ